MPPQPTQSPVLPATSAVPAPGAAPPQASQAGPTDPSRQTGAAATPSGGAPHNTVTVATASQARGSGPAHPDTDTPAVTARPQPAPAPAGQTGGASGETARPAPADATRPALPAQTTPAQAGTAATDDTAPAAPLPPDRTAERTRPDAAARHSPAEPAATGHATPDSTAPAPAAAEPAASAAQPAAPAAAAPAAAAPSGEDAKPAAVPAAPAAAAAPVQPTPAEQTLPALVSLGGSQGTRHVTIRLDPQELGQLQIRVAQSGDGTAQVTLTAERPQTLDLLVRDQDQLHRALDQAGVPAEGRSIAFHLAPAAAAAPADPHRAAASPDAATAGTGSGMGTGGGGSERLPQQDGFAAPPRRTAAIPADGPTEVNAPQQAASRWQRAGIDITA